MAETATTRPARKRATPATTVTKPAAKATVAKPATAAVAVASVEGPTKFGFSMDQLDPTKTYAKFTPPASSGCVGTLYVPHGTVEVKVLVIGPNAE